MRPIQLLTPLILLIAGGTAAAQDPATKLAHVDRVLEQGYVHRHWTIEDGLPVNAVRDVAQTEDGFIWLTTIEGLVRFDGDEFVVFNPGNTPVMDIARRTQLAVLPNGDLLVDGETDAPFVRRLDGTFARLEIDGRVIERAHLSWKQERMLFVHDEGFEATRFHWLDGEMVRQSVPDHTFFAERWDNPGELWGKGAVVNWGSRALTDDQPNGLFRHNGSAWERVEYEDRRPYIQVEQLVQEPDTVWTVDDRGRLGQLVGDRWTVVDERLAPHLQILTGEKDNGVPQCLFRRPDGSFYFALGRDTGNGGMYLYREGQVTRITESQGRECFYKVDGRGDTWIGFSDGLVRNGESLLAVRAVALMEDREGSVWAATDDGLHQFSPAAMKVLGVPQGLSTGNTYGTLEDDAGRVWVQLWNSAYGHVIENGTLRRIPEIGPTFHRSRNGLYSMAQDRTLVSGYQVDFSAPDHGLTRVPKRLFYEARIDAGLMDHLGPGMREDGGIAGVSVLYEDVSGIFWIGAHNGLYRWDGSDWTVTGDWGVRAIAEAPAGVLWLGSQRHELKRLRDGVIEPMEWFPTFGIRGIAVDVDDPLRLWVATEELGLYRLDLTPEGDLRVLAPIRKTDGLFQDGLHIAIEDDFGRMWMNTNFGVFWVWKEDLNAFADGRLARVQSTVYTEADGLLHREGNGGMQTSGMKASDGRLWFPSQGGLSVFAPANIPGREPAVAVITGVRSRGVAVDRGSAGWELQPRERDFTVDFTAPTFRSPELVEFEYQLFGYDDDWLPADDRSAGYTNLSPRDYTFRVRTLSRGDVAAVAEARITVEPFWFETWAFYSLVGLLLGGSVFGAFGYRAKLARDRERELNAQVQERTVALREKTEALLIEKEITEKQAAELRELNQAKNRFFANVTHEFRTPLALILGPLKQFLAREPSEDTETYQVMRRNAEKLLGLVNRILELAKLESKSLPFQPVVGNLALQVSDIVHGFADLAQQRGVRLIMGPTPPRFALFDPKLIDRVFTNLLSNALKFTEAGGEVIVSVWERSAEVSVEVRDSGIGIAEEKQPFVFDRFYQVDSSSTRKYEGTGIGLALVKELVELHGGRVELFSREGLGAAFTVTLPLVPEEAASVIPAIVPEAVYGGNGAAAPTPVERPAADPEDRTTVMVVDDNPDIRGFLRSVLASEYRVVEAADGQEALDHLREDTPDLVVTDIMMPNMDGLELNRALKADPETDTLPVIFLTALVEDTHRLEALIDDVDQYIAKPVDGAVLLEQVRNILRRRRHLRERVLESAGITVSDDAGPFERQLRDLIGEHLADPGLGASELADLVALSRSQVARKLKAEREVTPSELIRQVRIEAACRMLAEGVGNISEVAYAVGFNGLSYFNRCFKAERGQSPSEYLKELTV